ncbi:hypothetical protein AMELA_G00156920 [Ameiurus melas]|uniref:Uncharacterized protein n=1 Tax=Ameiurus melas TaxID=219545 RepID=A0A7J6AHU4_AMEME|nr:hypothetical protein AMELA_G00156920 [Ameiurus melas]
MAEECVVPRPRGHVPMVCAGVLSTLALGTVWLLDSGLTIDKLILLIAQVIFALSLGVTLHSICLLTEEWLFHSQQR